MNLLIAPFQTTLVHGNPESFLNETKTTTIDGAFCETRMRDLQEGSV
jgi:hypothetical protein